MVPNEDFLIYPAVRLPGSQGRYPSEQICGDGFYKRVQRNHLFAAAPLSFLDHLPRQAMCNNPRVTDERIDAEEPESAPRSTNWLAWVVVAAVLCAAAISGRWMMAGASGEGTSADEASPKSVLPLEPFVVNLADPDEKAYLRIGVSLGLDHPQSGKESIPVAALRDSIVGVLAASRPGDLLTAEGKSKLKADLLHALQSREPQLAVREVYFTEFLIQR